MQDIQAPISRISVLVDSGAFQSGGPEGTLYKVGEKSAYGCECVKHRVYSHIIIYELLYYFPS